MYKFYISDQAVATFPYKLNSLMTGYRKDIYATASEHNNTMDLFMIHLKEKNLLAAKRNEQCAHYPNEAHDSYADCVAEENNKNVRPALGCLAPWMSDKDQCTGLLTREPGHNAIIDWLVFVYMYSQTGFVYKSVACLLPCQTVTAKLSFLQTDVTGNNMADLRHFQIW